MIKERQRIIIKTNATGNILKNTNQYNTSQREILKGNKTTE